MQNIFIVGSKPANARHPAFALHAHKNRRWNIFEPRTLLSVAGSGQLNLVSTTGSGSATVYHYDITVNSTGTTSISTFWFAWIPGQDFLPSAPLTETSPTGWGAAVTGSNNQTDGSAIEWTTTSNPIAAGHSLSGFDFTSPDSPTALAGQSPTHSIYAATLSTIYNGPPFSADVAQFTVAPPVTTAASTTTVGSSQPSINDGDSVTFTATVSGSGATPTGTVTFFEDGSSIGTGQLQSGAATLTTSALPAGSLSITAQYGGDANFSDSTSAALTETVAAGTSPTTTALTASSPSSAAGASVSFTATIAPVTPGGLAPTGIVTFILGGNSIGNAAVQTDGTAVLAITSLPVGADAITASYSGDGTYAPSTSAAFTETVATPATLTPTIVKSTLPSALVAGTAVHGNITVNIANTTAGVIKGKITVQLFATADGLIDGSAIEVGHVTRNKLRVTTTRPLPVSLQVKIPAGMLSAGSYTLLARVIDPASNQADSPGGPAIAVAAPFVSLSETVTKMTIPSTAVAGAKTNAVVNLRISNAGNIITPATTTAAVFASLSGILDANAVQIVSVGKPLRIRPGKFSPLNLRLLHIPAVAPGQYTILVQVTDPNGGLSMVTAGTVNITT